MLLIAVYHSLYSLYSVHHHVEPSHPSLSQGPLGSSTTVLDSQEEGITWHNLDPAWLSVFSDYTGRDNMAGLSVLVNSKEGITWQNLSPAVLSVLCD